MNSGLPEPGSRAASSEGLVEVSHRAPRKRRRPALSCVQCRRRKVKCDRKSPCTQCAQYNNTTCIYDDPEVRLAGTSTHTQTLHDTSPILPQNDVYGLSHPTNAFSFNTPIQRGPRSLEIRSPTANALWGSAPSAEYPHSHHHASESSVGPGTPQSEASIQELKERLRKLEELVSSSVNYVSKPIETEPKPDDPKLKGSLDKTRFFGMNHWMHPDEV